MQGVHNKDQSSPEGLPYERDGDARDHSGRGLGFISPLKETILQYNMMAYIYIHLIATSLSYKNGKRKKPNRNKLGWLTTSRELL